jgi:hypothetical protein
MFNMRYGLQIRVFLSVGLKVRVNLPCCLRVEQGDKEVSLLPRNG